MPPRKTAASGMSTVSTYIVIEDVQPTVDGGRYPIKRVVGEPVALTAVIFREGHGALRAVVKWRPKGGRDWTEVPLVPVNHGLAQWAVSFVPGEGMGRVEYAVEAWGDDWGSWRHEMTVKRDAGQDVSLEAIEGMTLLEAALGRAKGEDKVLLASCLADAKALETGGGRATILLSAKVHAVMTRNPDRSKAVVQDPILEVIVDPPRARFAAWYEMFPRSQSGVPGLWGTFKDCEARLPDVRTMGFDTLYFVPIHPIGRMHRKGPNNSLNAGPDDPGSPYAIGAEEGGHMAIHPALGTLEDFRHLVGRAKELGMDVALDIAIQCAPDHPWIKEHPDWFRFRPDGTIKYAENPPKKYQDIVNVEFWGDHQDDLWMELYKVFKFWVDQGVSIFRVDNPHTKPIPFWEWVIGAIKADHPEAIFLAEAFTRPPMMKMLAKVGFTQSYSYFTWRTTKADFTEYLTELTKTDCAEYMRVNFFTSTPDILPLHLQTGGRPAFMSRLVLASTLSGVYGIYNGYELCESDPIPGKEEYNHSEKYDFKVWDWNRPGHIKDYIAKVNWIRNENPALHDFTNLNFLRVDNDEILFYWKATRDRSNMIFVAVNLNPHAVREGLLWLPLFEMGIGDDHSFHVEELLSGSHLEWTGSAHDWRFDPEVNPAAIFRVSL
ncbi:MAG: alpha-1,4-glucan--maltose-1-phosphate maltosyltransferase [Rhodospirillum sp.]|nr:alpha-1,4-glucan--maltose-1-phosphate maltosyltransferase [Rhodospirillum sp.]MCF8487769.1 alpha-1,4-glucan--maltose-1-phosphate maltosyltransferase [Rhodospirillum sp.]